MKSFINKAQLEKVAIRMDDLLSPEDRGKMQGLQKDLKQKKVRELVPDFNPDEALPSSFRISEPNIDADAPRILRAVFKYPAIRTVIDKIEFEIRKDKNFILHDKLVKPRNIDPNEYYQKNFNAHLKSDVEGMKAMLYRQVDFATDLGYRTARAKELLKTALLGDVKVTEDEDSMLPKQGFTESAGKRAIRQAINVASQALRKLKAKFKLGRLNQMGSAFDTAIHALSMGKSVASVDLDEDPVRKPRIKTTDLGSEYAVPMLQKQPKIRASRSYVNIKKLDMEKK